MSNEIKIRRVPGDVKTKINKLAEADGISTNEYLLRLVETVAEHDG